MCDLASVSDVVSALIGVVVGVGAEASVSALVRRRERRQAAIDDVHEAIVPVSAFVMRSHSGLQGWEINIRHLDGTTERIPGHLDRLRLASALRRLSARIGEDDRARLKALTDALEQEAVRESRQASLDALREIDEFCATLG